MKLFKKMNYKQTKNSKSKNHNAYNIKQMLCYINNNKLLAIIISNNNQQIKSNYFEDLNIIYKYIQVKFIQLLNNM